MIYLSRIGKKYRNKWIFKGIDFAFKCPGIYGITGANGSGKSTLLRILSGMQNPTVGKCRYSIDNQTIKDEKFYRHLSYCAPGMTIIEEMTLKEFLNFHFTFKDCQPKLTIKHIIEILEFEAVQNKYIHEFSSGMKQRVKLAQAFFADTKALFLDEPCSNLDEKGFRLYESLMEKYTNNRLVIIASNNDRELKPAQEQLEVSDFSPKQ